MKIGSWAKDHGYILKLLKSKQRLFNETADFDYAHVPKRWNNVEVQVSVKLIQSSTFFWMKLRIKE